LVIPIPFKAQAIGLLPARNPIFAFFSGSGGDITGTCGVTLSRIRPVAQHVQRDRPHWAADVNRSLGDKAGLWSSMPTDDVAFLQPAALAGLSFSTAAMRTPRGSKERRQGRLSRARRVNW